MDPKQNFEIVAYYLNYLEFDFESTTLIFDFTLFLTCCKGIASRSLLLCYFIFISSKTKSEGYSYLSLRVINNNTQ